MMRQLRDKRLMHFVLWTLVFVFVSFIFFSWGMKFTAGDKHDRSVAAQVGEDRITYAEFQKAYQPSADKLYKLRDGSPSQDEVRKLQSEVLDRLVEERLLREAGEQLGLSVSDDELMGSIQRQNYFLGENGKFDKKRYYDILAANQMTPEQFENEERDQILLQKIQTLFQDGALYSPGDIQDYASLLSREMKVRYVGLDLSEYEGTFHPSEEELESYYRKNRSRYDHPERAKIRHILINLQGNESLQDEQKAKASLEDYRSQILSGKATFEELAKKFSQDPGSKDRGGDLGWISRDNLQKDLEPFDPLFKMKKGEISKPFKTKFGFHLAQLVDHEKEYKSSLSQDRAKVLSQYRKEKATLKIMTLAEGLGDRLKEKETLEKAAEELGLSSEETSWFTRGGGIPHLKDSRDISEELADLYPQQWRGPLALGQKEYFFQVTEARPSSEKSEGPGDGQALRGLSAQRQRVWLEDYLASLKKKLRVKTYLDQPGA